MPLVPPSGSSFPIPPPHSTRSTIPRILEDPHLPGLLNELARAREALEQTRAVTECLVLAMDELHLGMALHEILTDENEQPVDYRFLQVNAGFERLTGLKRSQLIGRTVLECFPSTDSSWIAIYGRIALGGERLGFEAIAGRCGRIFEISAFQAGARTFALVFQDVTAMRELEEALEKTRASFRQLTESAGEMIFVVAGSRLLYANLACCMITGYSLEELNTLGLEGLLVPEERNTYRELLSRFAQEDGYCTRREFRIATRDGEFRAIGLGARPIDWEGTPAVLHFAVELPHEVQKAQKPPLENIESTPGPVIVLRL